MNKLKGQKIVSCRICKGDHWTTRCPYKDTLGPMQKELAEQLGLSTGEKEKLPGGAGLGMLAAMAGAGGPAVSARVLSPVLPLCCHLPHDSVAGLMAPDSSQGVCAFLIGCTSCGWETGVSRVCVTWQL